VTKFDLPVGLGVVDVKRESSPSETTSMPAISWVRTTTRIASISDGVDGMAASHAGIG
jgi:hypothetical protein